MKILLAGKASEEIIFDHKSTGAKDDLKKVTDIANQMVCEYGMSDLRIHDFRWKSTKHFYLKKFKMKLINIIVQCYNETLIC